MFLEAYPITEREKELISAPIPEANVRVNSERLLTNDLVGAE